MIDEILEKYNLKYDDLNVIERETLNTWVDALQQGVVSIDKIKDYIQTMRDSVINELTNTKIETKQDLFLKARLRNYILLEAFLSTPEKAKAQMERALSGIIKKA